MKATKASSRKRAKPPAKRGRKKGRQVVVTKTFRFSPEHSRMLARYASTLSMARGKRVTENGAMRELIEGIPDFRG